MEEITSLPSGYRPSIKLAKGRQLPYDSDKARIESGKLLKFFGNKSHPVGLCIHGDKSEEIFSCISKALKMQQENKQSVFYPCVTSESALLECIKAFSFFIPAPNVFQHFFTIAPNYFYTSLTEEERVVSDIKILNSMSGVLVSSGHPYEELIDVPIIRPNPEEDFSFDLSTEECI
jgi:hypothetical protein